MKVIDSGVVVELLVGSLQYEALGSDELAAPHLIDSEVVNVLRTLVRSRVLSDEQGEAALRGFAELALQRYPADWVRPRMWELRHSVSAYDATYIALAEILGAEALLTTDARLARAPGTRCPIELVR